MNILIILIYLELPKGVVSCGDGWYSKINGGFVDAFAICVTEGYQGPITDSGVNYGTQCRKTDLCCQNSFDLSRFVSDVSWKCSHGN